MPKLLADRFLKNVYKTDTCWLWTGTKRRDGYGIFLYNKKMWAAHRLAYYLYKFQDPGDMYVCHSCDNKACVNPDHLWLGTAKDNTRDMIDKGRSKLEPGGHRHKLTEEQVLEIKQSNLSQYKIAEQYGISPTHAWRTKNA